MKTSQKQPDAKSTRLSDTTPARRAAEPPASDLAAALAQSPRMTAQRRATQAIFGGPVGTLQGAQQSPMQAARDPALRDNMNLGMKQESRNQASIPSGGNKVMRVPPASLHDPSWDK